MDPQGKKPPVPEGMGMPPMMQQMMQKKMMAGMQEFNPMAMCKAMIASVGKAAEMAAYATPEVRTLFEESTRGKSPPSATGGISLVSRRISFRLIAANSSADRAPGEPRGRRPAELAAMALTLTSLHPAFTRRARRPVGGR